MYRDHLRTTVLQPMHRLAVRLSCGAAAWGAGAWTVLAQAPPTDRYPAVEPQRAEHFECMLPPEAFLRSFNDLEWPEGFVPFEFDTDLSAAERQHAREAMDWWTTTTGVKFVYRIHDEPAFIFVTRSADAGISWSTSIGRSGSQQEVQIADSHWSDHGIIAHELCHAIGWYHEQSRPDSDCCVVIEWDNIEPGRESQFEKIEDSLTLGNAYDYESIMHYRACAFSTCDACDPGDSDCRTITTVDPEWQDAIGQRDELSDGDILDVSTVYGARDARYVDVGAAGDGRLSAPYGSVAMAADAVESGGWVLIRGGSYPETGVFDRAGSWRAHGALVRIGD